MTRQNIVTEARESFNYKKSETMDILEELIEEFRKEGIKKGKKIAIYDVWLRGYDFEFLSNIFSLPIKDIKAIIEEMVEELKKSK